MTNKELLKNRDHLLVSFELELYLAPINNYITYINENHYQGYCPIMIGSKQSCQKDRNDKTYDLSSKRSKYFHSKDLIIKDRPMFIPSN